MLYLDPRKHPTTIPFRRRREAAARMIATSGGSTARNHDDPRHRLAQLARTPGRRRAALLGRPRQYCQGGASTGLRQYPGSQTEYEAQARRGPLRRLPQYSQRFCAALSYPPPGRCFLPLLTCRTRRRTIDRCRIFWEAFFWGWHRDALGRNMVCAPFFALHKRQAKATSHIEFLNLPSRSKKQNDWDG